MQTKVFSKSSWTYKFLAWHNKTVEWNLPRDICDFRSKVLVKFIKVSLLVSLAFTYVTSIIREILRLLSPYFVSLSMFSEMTHFSFLGRFLMGLTGILLAFIAFLFGAYLVNTAWNALIEKRRKYLSDKWDREYDQKYAEFKSLTKKGPNPVVAMYKSWKEKLCYPVEFK